MAQFSNGRNRAHTRYAAACVRSVGRIPRDGSPDARGDRDDPPIGRDERSSSDWSNERREFLFAVVKVSLRLNLKKKNKIKSNASFYKNDTSFEKF